MTTRLATTKDIPQLVELRMQEQECDWGNQYSITKELKNTTTDFFIKNLNVTFYTFVIEFEGQIVATASLIPHQYLPQADELTGRRAYLCNVWTVPELRRKGLQKLLFEEVSYFCVEHEIKRVDLDASERPEVYEMYKHFGYTFRNNHARLLF